MTTKREIEEAFKNAVQEMITILEGRGNMSRLQDLTEEYERLSGLSRKAAGNKILAEANRRRNQDKK